MLNSRLIRSFIMVRMWFSLLFLLFIWHQTDSATTTAWIRRSSAAGWTGRTKAAGAAWGTTPRTSTDHHSISGKSGHIEQWNQHPSYPTIEFYHIDNPNNDPIVIHFKAFDYTDSGNCTRESLTFYPRDWPYEDKVQRFCGKSLPGNGHLYFQSLGAIESKREAFSRSTFSFDYETIVKNVALLPKSRLLEILRNMEQQNQALEGEANFAYNLVNDSHINNFAKRSIGTSETPTVAPVFRYSQRSIPSQAQGLVTRHQTGTPSHCVERWSNWINKDTPSTGDGDREMMSQSELQQFCDGGKINATECETTTGIYNNTGEIFMCTIAGGLECLNNDNFPFPCSDYKIRNYCQCI